MAYNLRFLLDALKIRGEYSHYNPNTEALYQGVRWLSAPAAELANGYLYVGPASLLPANITSSQTGVITVNNCGYDFSACGIEAIVFPMGTDLAAICFQLMERFMQSPPERNPDSVLFERLLAKRSVKEILDIAHDYLQNPILLDYSFRSKHFLYTSEKTALEQGQILRNVAPQAHQLSSDEETSRYISQLTHSPTPTLLENGSCFQGSRRIHVSFTRGSDNPEPIGMLIVFEAETPFPSQAPQFLAMIARAISQKALQPNFHSDICYSNYEQRIQSILSGHPADPNESWLDILHADRYQNYTVAVMDTRKLDHSEHLRLTLLRRIRFGVTVTRGSYLILLANAKTPGRSAELISHLDEIAEKYDLTIGVSEPFQSIHALQSRYQQAKRAREISIALGRPSRATEFDRVKHYILLDSFPRDLSFFQSSSMRRLSEYDATENTDYCHTLLTYIRCGMNREQTRITLNIHRNTLPYRLKKIEEILGHSLDDGELLLNLYLSEAASQLKAKRPKN